MIRKSTRTGPLPASASLVLDPLPPDRWRRTLAAAVDRRWERSRALVFVAAYIQWGLLCVTLWWIGYPTWRLAVLAGLLVVLVGLQLRTQGASESQTDKRIPVFVMTVAVAVTGGLHSPFLIALPSQFSGEVIRYGWSRSTAVSLAAFGVAAIVMACVPAAWVGPPIPDPVFTISLVVILLLSTALQTDYLVLLTRTASDALRQLVRSRDERAEEALTRAAELERMSSHLSHELKNPLGAIKALVQLSVRAERDPEVLARLEVVQDEVERMQSILQGYLSFSRPLEALRPEPVALGPLVDEVLAILEGRAEAAHLALGRSGDAGVTADPRRLKQAVLNLVANAIDATPPGGEVRVRVAPAGETVVLQVEDTGHGMTPDELARVGTPFFTTRETGTGLGVSLARGVFLQHGGTLEYTSAPGQGTVATATLPIAYVEAGLDGARIAGR